MATAFPSAAGATLSAPRRIRVYTAREACVKLGIDAKTLRAWRSCPLCNITGQPSPVDGRLLLYTLEDLRRIATNHGRTLHGDEEVAREAHSPSKRELLVRVSELEDEVAHAMAMLGNPKPAPLPPLMRQAPLPVPDTPRMLDDGLIAWRTMATAHEIPATTVAKAIEAGRLPVVNGEWKIGRQIVQHALDAEGQERFYTLWHNSPRFRACPDCPHSFRRAAHTRPLDEMA